MRHYCACAPHTNVHCDALKCAHYDGKKTALSATYYWANIYSNEMRTKSVAKGVTRNLTKMVRQTRGMHTVHFAKRIEICIFNDNCKYSHCAKVWTDALWVCTSVTSIIHTRPHHNRITNSMINRILGVNFTLQNISKKSIEFGFVIQNETAHFRHRTKTIYQ